MYTLYVCPCIYIYMCVCVCVSVCLYLRVVHTWYIHPYMYVEGLWWMDEARLSRIISRSIEHGTDGTSARRRLVGKMARIKVRLLDVIQITVRTSGTGEAGEEAAEAGESWRSRRRRRLCHSGRASTTPRQALSPP
jgi:hypothetical protein